MPYKYFHYYYFYQNLNNLAAAAAAATEKKTDSFDHILVDLHLCLSTKCSVFACCLPATLTGDILFHLKLTWEYLHFWLLTSAG